MSLGMNASVSLGTGSYDWVLVSMTWYDLECQCYTPSDVSSKAFKVLWRLRCPS